MAATLVPPLDPVRKGSWATAERGVAAVVTILVAMRFNLPHLLTLGNAATLSLLPVWLPTARRYVGARAVVALGSAAVVSGVVLTVLSAGDHPTGPGTLADNSVLVVGLLADFGFLLWARERLGDGWLVVLFGLGLLLGLGSAGPLFATDPWKFGFSTGVTLAALGLAHLLHSRAVELLAVVALLLASAATDSRSSFGQLLLVGALLAWQVRPTASTRLGSALRGVLGLGAGAVAIYGVGQALILHGFLGAATQVRSQQQIDESGSLLLGGRPEISATLALMRDHVWGFGSGTRVSHHDLLVAKAGMAAINYDPDNGYVEKYMFGQTYELHSVLADLWSRFGLVGLALGLLALFLVLRWTGASVTAGTASAVVLFLAAKALWNLVFSPLYSSVGLLSVTLALVVAARVGTGADPTGDAPPVTLLPAAGGHAA